MILRILAVILFIALVLLLFNIYKVVKDALWFKKQAKRQQEFLKLGISKSKHGAGKVIGKIQRHFSTMNPKERNKSKFYKYYHTMRTAIMSNGFDDYIGVEVLFIIILITSIIVTAILTAGLMVFLKVFVFIITLVALHTIILFISRAGMFDRVIQLMKAQDMLCSSMELGIVKAISDNVEYIDKSVRLPFENFITNHLQLRVSVDESLKALNAEVGSIYDAFCERANQHYLENDRELINGFRGLIADNNRKRDRMLRRKNIFDRCMMYYGLMMIASTAFVLFMAGMLGDLAQFFGSTTGRVSTIISISAGAIGFIISQMIYTGGVDQ